MIWLLLAVCAIAALYQLIALIACISRTSGTDPHTGGLQTCSGDAVAVSILKPILHATPDVHRAILTHLSQTYPDFELLLGVRDSEAASLSIADPRARVIVCRTVKPNNKVGTLIDLAREARHPILIVNDADIAVPPDYIRDVVAHLPTSPPASWLPRSSASPNLASARLWHSAAPTSTASADSKRSPITSPTTINWGASCTRWAAATSSRNQW